ncbi:hypothetical protein HYS31_04865 [Candidatus Woesearchaeota archaeon]|nr:hypothetical protein [Candidatus Woesearchaeota archaeon]
MSKIILSSIKESFASIWKQKALFFALMALQALFFALFFYLSMNYQAKILLNAKAISDYVGQQSFDDPSIASNILEQKSILGDDPLRISRNFNEMRINFIAYLAYSFILGTIFMSLSWALSSRLKGREGKFIIKNFMVDFMSNIIVLSFSMALVFIFLILMFGIPLELIEAKGVLIRFLPFIAFSIVLCYFTLVALALPKPGLKNVIHRALVVGITKIHYILAACSASLLLLAASVILMYHFLEGNLMALSASVLLFIFSFVFGRILLAKVVEKVEALF